MATPGGADVSGYILYRNDGSADDAVSIEVAEQGATTTTSNDSFEVTGQSSMAVGSCVPE